MTRKATRSSVAIRRRTRRRFSPASST
jgi:hypothetical protein